MDIQSVESEDRDDDLPEPQRDGTSKLEEAALRQLENGIAAYPGEFLYRLVLWPQPIAAACKWAGLRDIDGARALNGSSGRPYRGQRALLAQRIHLTQQQLELALDQPRPPLSTLEGAIYRPWKAAHPHKRRPLRQPECANLPLRDGTSALEHLALERVRDNLAAMPPGLVLQILIYPHQLTDLAMEVQRRHPAAVDLAPPQPGAIPVRRRKAPDPVQALYNAISYARKQGSGTGLRYDRIRKGIAKLLDTTLSDLSELLDVAPRTVRNELPAPPEPTDPERLAAGVTARRRG